MRELFSLPVKKIENLLKTKDPKFWQKRGEQMALGLFKAMSQRVPAYKDFLKKHKINPNKIQVINDFKNLPIIDKNTYLRSYPLEKLCWDGKLVEHPMVFAASSGTTGEPFYFPRTVKQDEQYAKTAELYLRNNFSIHNKTTLYVNCFALGVWIGGIFTYEAIATTARHGKYKLSIINPGLNKQEIFRAIKKISPLFEQTIIAGYPPFVKELVDQGESSGINWKNYNIKFVFSAEGFSETWRDHVLKKVGLKNCYDISLNHYGTVDLGTMAHETPLSILIRREASKNKLVFNTLFEQTGHLPTLCQYIPEQFYFEEINRRLLCSAYSGIPLVRYDLKDVGGIIPFSKPKDLFQKFNINLGKLAQKKHIKNSFWQIPFVYVMRRENFSVKLQLYDIFPETIKEALFCPKILKSITGKFTLATKYNKQHDQYLEINTELNKDTKLNKETKKLIISRILKALEDTSSGPGSNIKEILKQKNLVEIVPWVNGHEQFFNLNIKQKWIQK